jgi:Flp pilus assembly protein protease CpaA
MLGFILLAIGIIGFGVTGYLDLKTTEFPDWMPYAMIVGALAVRGVFAFMLNDLSIITESVVWGAVFLAIGLAMYYTRQWGDGDAWLLGALGFLFPAGTGFAAASAPATGIGMTAFPFPVIMLFNFFFISFFYLIAYSLALGLSAPKVSSQFMHYLKGNARSIVLSIAAITAVCMALVAYLLILLGVPPGQLVMFMLLPVVFTALLMFLHFGKFIEGKLFKRQIAAKDLTPGDVPISGKWKVLTEKEVRMLKRKGGKIWIKEGVRFAPVFIITMLLTLFYGNLMLLVLSI